MRPGKPEDGMKGVLLGISSGLDQALARLNGRLLNSAWGVDIGSGCHISLTATLDKTNPRGVDIGANTDVSSRADIWPMIPSIFSTSTPGSASAAGSASPRSSILGSRLATVASSPRARLSCVTSPPVASLSATRPGWWRKTSGPENTG